MKKDRTSSSVNQFKEVSVLDKMYVRNEWN